MTINMKVYPIEKNNICKNCKHFHQKIGDDGVGDCRRYPPIIQNETDDVSLRKIGEIFNWYLRVYEDSWCGEFKKRTRKLLTLQEAFPNGMHTIFNKQANESN